MLLQRNLRQLPAICANKAFKNLPKFLNLRKMCSELSIYSSEKLTAQKNHQVWANLASSLSSTSYPKPCPLLLNWSELIPNDFAQKLSNVKMPKNNKCSKDFYNAFSATRFQQKYLSCRLFILLQDVFVPDWCTLNQDKKLVKDWNHFSFKNMLCNFLVSFILNKSYLLNCIIKNVKTELYIHSYLKNLLLQI